MGGNYSAWNPGIEASESDVRSGDEPQNTDVRNPMAGQFTFSWKTVTESHFNMVQVNFKLSLESVYSVGTKLLCAVHQASRPVYRRVFTSSHQKEVALNISWSTFAI